MTTVASLSVVVGSSVAGRPVCFVVVIARGFPVRLQSRHPVCARRATAGVRRTTSRSLCTVWICTLSTVCLSLPPSPPPPLSVPDGGRTVAAATAGVTSSLPRPPRRRGTGVMNEDTISVHPPRLSVSLSVGHIVAGHAPWQRPRQASAGPSDIRSRLQSPSATLTRQTVRPPLRTT